MSKPAHDVALAEAGPAKPMWRLTRLLEPRMQTRGYLHALLWVAFATVASFVLVRLGDVANIVMVYLLAVVMVAARWGEGPSVAATLLAVACCAYFSLVPTELSYLPTYFIVLCVGLVVSTLTSRLRSEVMATTKREAQNRTFYQLSRALAAAEDRDAVAAVVEEHVGRIFDCISYMYEWHDGNLVPSSPATGVLHLSPEQEYTALRALREGASAREGHLLFLPMVVANVAVGLLVVADLDGGHINHAPSLRLLEALASTAAIALQRMIVGDEARKTQQHIDQERLRNTMLSSMSHDFRTPLASIIGAISTVIDNDDRLDASTRLDLMQTVREEAEFLERQIRNMLDLTRLESANLQIRREWHPMDEVIGGALTRAEKVLEGFRVDTDVPGHLPLVAIDASLIERMLVNLLENAARFAPPGSAIAVSAHLRDNDLCLAVGDRGPGIPPNQHERVFEKFYRIGTSRSGGAGLGLAICRAIAQLHGGRIWVEDRPGGGALFQVVLPLVGTPPNDPPDLRAHEPR